MAKEDQMTSTVEIGQLWIPDSLDADDAKDFLAAVEVSRRVRMQIWGTDDLAYTPLEKLLELGDPYERQVILVARVDGRIVGTVDIALPLADNMDLAEFTLDILPEFQRRGVGRQLLEAAEHFARSEGRTMIMVDTNHPAESLRGGAEGQLVPGSGLGFVPLASREVDFARRTGYTLQHIEQFSSCALPLEPRPRTPAVTGSTTGPTVALSSGSKPWPRWRTRPGKWCPKAMTLRKPSNSSWCSTPVCCARRKTPPSRRGAER
jgi:GNAT superfamily N-acetyltransferase